MKKVFIIIWAIVCCIWLISCSNTSPQKTTPPVSASTYYRDQMVDTQSREWYDKIKQNAGSDEIFIFNFNGFEGLDPNIPAKLKSVILAVEMDNPLLKPITEQYTIEFVALNNDYTSVDMVLRIGTVDLEETDNQIKQVERKVADFISSLPNSMNETDKVYAIYDWICDMASYDYAMSSTSHNLSSTLLKNFGVCDSFSGAFKYVCDRAGITCIEVRGCAFDPKTNNYTENHAWNIVYVSNTWKVVDCTYGVQYKTSTIPHDYCCISIDESVKTFKPTASVIGYQPQQIIGVC